MANLPKGWVAKLKGLKLFKSQDSLAAETGYLYLPEKRTERRNACNLIKKFAGK